jgi:hypothetical protein
MVAQSSWISLFEYDPAQLRLTTHLKDGSIHQHTFVTALDWAGLQTAQSHGKHWANNIKGKKLGIRVKSARAPLGEIKRSKQNGK